MLSLQIKTLIIMGLCLCISHTSWAEVYKWFDDDGTVHYSDRKPQDAESTQITTRKQTSANKAVSADEYAGNTQKKLDAQLQTLQESEEIETLQQRQQEELAANNEAMTKYCDTLKNNINVLATKARLKTKGEDGELRFMSPEEIVKTRQADQQSYEEKCR